MFDQRMIVGELRKLESKTLGRCWMDVIILKYSHVAKDKDL